jgi:hypothetical protein
MTRPWDPRTTPRHIHEDDFYEIEGAREQKEFLIRYAVLAPSSHNTQPWSFRITDDGIEVYADYGRRLPVCDPADRELLMSVGAAVTNLRVAAAHFGFESSVLYQPSDDASLPVALVSLTETCDPDEDLRRLFPAIQRRHTNRQEFEKREIEPDVLDRLCEAVEESEIARFVPPHERASVAELVDRADRLLLADERWRKELAEWVRPNDSADGDGMSGDAFGIPGPLSAFAPWLVRSFDIGESRGRVDRGLAENAAGLIVIAGDDDRTSLLRAGETLERLLLFLTSLGIAYAFLNQPIEVPELRRDLWHLMRTAKPPQLLLRIGYARPVKLGMPRRKIDTVLAER